MTSTSYTRHWRRETRASRRRDRRPARRPVRVLWPSGDRRVLHGDLWPDRMVRILGRRAATAGRSTVGVIDGTALALTIWLAHDDPIEATS